MWPYNYSQPNELKHGVDAKLAEKAAEKALKKLRRTKIKDLK
jgi:hypothetical protein